MRIIIGVCGSGNLYDENVLKVYEKAERIGREIAKNKGILICGGKGGVMEAACKGAKQEQGITIGILPYERDEKNEFVDIPIVTGIGEKRNAIIVQSADCIIAIAGMWGTLNEITLAAIYQIPVVFLKDSGGFVDKFIQSDFIKNESLEYQIVEDEVEAVKQAFRLAKKNQTKH